VKISDLIPTWLRASAPSTPPSTQQPNALELTAEVNITAAAPGSEGQPAKRPSFMIAGYTGAPMNVEGFYYPVIVDLSGLRASGKTLPILRDHDRNRVVGQANDIAISAKGVNVGGIITGDSGDAADVVAHAKNGFKWQASIGASIHRREFLEAGKTATVNGRQVSGPLIIARDATLKEISFTAIGADGQTSASVAASANTAQTQENDAMTFEQWLTAKGFDPATLTDAQRTSLKAMYDAPGTPGTPGTPGSPGNSSQGGGTTTAQREGSGGAPTQPAGNQNVNASGGRTGASAPGADDPDLVASYRQQLAAESTRVSEIRQICAQFRNPTVKTDGGSDEPLEARAIREGWDRDKTELHAMRMSRASSPGAIVPGVPPAQLGRVLEASLSMGSGIAEDRVAASLPAGEREQVMNLAASSTYRHAGLHMLMDMCIRAAGMHYAGDRKSNDFIRAAYEADQVLRAASGFSTISLTGILSNLANKVLLNAFTAVESVVPQIAADVTATDFKQFKMFRLTGKGEFTEVGSDGELKHVGLQEADYANQVKTVGALLTLTRVMQINDDLSAFNQVNAVIGRMAGINLQKTVFKLWLSNPGSFWHDDNGNYVEGADTALSIEALTAVVAKFWELKDDNGDPISVPPAKLLVSPALKVTADTIYSSTTVNETTTANKPKPTDNPHKGLYKPVVAPWLSPNFNLPGASNKAWWLMADPGVLAAIQVAYLRGRKVPTIESADTDFKTLGTQFRGYFDFGVAMHEKRAGVKSKGEA
jgi:phage head maturation protease